MPILTQVFRKLLLKRECIPVEKGDLITWLMTIE